MFRLSSSSFFVTYNYRLQFFYPGLNEKPLSCANIFYGDIVDFVPWIGLRIFPYSK